MAPALNPEGLRGGFVGWDGQLEDDARLVVAVARTAAAYGAEVLTGVEVIRADNGTAVLRDEDGEFDLACQHIITCTGVWTEELNPEVPLHPSRGTHLVIDSARLGHPTASMTVGVPGEFGRFVFAMPQPDGLTYVGLTDVETDSLLPDPPVGSEEELSFLLDVVSQTLAVPLSRSDILGTYSGLRPLVRDSHASTADISRRHLVARQPNGVIAVTGGKLTTYRRMAQDAVDLISGAPCRTPEIALVGAPGDSRSRDRLTRRYGAEADLLRDAIDRDPTLGELIAGTPARAVEVAWAKQAEGALTPGQAAETRLRVMMVEQTRAQVLAGVEAAW
jgi:glycerol-3-phosphate dehydrogenase